VLVPPVRPYGAGLTATPTLRFCPFHQGHPSLVPPPLSSPLGWPPGAVLGSGPVPRGRSPSCLAGPLRGAFEALSFSSPLSRAVRSRVSGRPAGALALGAPACPLRPCGPGSPPCGSVPFRRAPSCLGALLRGAFGAVLLLGPLSPLPSNDRVVGMIRTSIS
jgi:hypothetical protein